MQGVSALGFRTHWLRQEKTIKLQHRLECVEYIE